MTLATWIAIGIAGPGALLVFCWFLRDAVRLRRRGPARKDRAGEDSARG